MVGMARKNNSLLSVSKISDTLKEKGYILKPWDINNILEDLRWQERTDWGWVTELKGSDRGAKNKSGKKGNYIVWPKTILGDFDFLEAVESYIEKAELLAKKNKNAQSFREKYRTRATIRTQDGHYVRSKAEAMIDNWLYRHGLVHVYEGRLAIEEEVYYDFYIPAKALYIEYWGLEGNTAYEERKAAKQVLYQAHGFNLLELTETDIKNLDDVMTHKFLRIGDS